jgi:hypothetical protein
MMRRTRQRLFPLLRLSRFGKADVRCEDLLSANDISMLLSHTNGHEYDWMRPDIIKWRASRGETMWSGPTVEAKSTVPLAYEPGTNWRYGHGSDWVND